jgi:hypothetical protein
MMHQYCANPYDEGLVSDDVYKDRQKAILSEP